MAIANDPDDLERLTPSAKRDEARPHYDRGHWMNFLRAGKHPFIREVLVRRQGGRCELCGRGLGRGLVHVHHLDYYRACKTASTIQIVRKSFTTDKLRRSKVPDCERCHRETPEQSAECIRRLAVLHAGCHKNLSRPGHDEG